MKKACYVLFLGGSWSSASIRSSHVYMRMYEFSWYANANTYVYTHIHTCIAWWYYSREMFRMQKTVPSLPPPLPESRHTYIHIHIHIYTHIYIYMYIYLHWCQAREKSTVAKDTRTILSLASTLESGKIKMGADVPSQMLRRWMLMDEREPSRTRGRHH